MSSYLKDYPDANGYFGPYGGAYVSDELKKEMAKIAEAYYHIGRSHDFVSELRRIRTHFQGRPTPVYYCRNLSNKFGGSIYLKREDLNHSGAHKLNHCMGEVMLAKYMGKKKVIAETGAGQHGVAMATAAAYFGLPCDIYMGEVDIAKQHPNVLRMKILGANVISVTAGQRTLKEAVDAAFEAYLKDPENIMYCIGSVVGPHPFPLIVRDFQKIVGEESRAQFLEMMGELPDAVCACVGGGSNAIGMFCGFLDDASVKLYGVEPLGRGSKPGEHAASMTYGKPSVLHGFKSYVLENEDGSPMPVYSVASGLDYQAIGPEHAFLHDQGRVEYVTADDKETIDAFYALSRHEGIIPAIESAHAVAYALRYVKEHPHNSILVNLSGRGDKDIDYVDEHYGHLAQASN